jgi:hypothetical protein
MPINTLLTNVYLSQTLSKEGVKEKVKIQKSKLLLFRQLVEILPF